MSKKKKICTFFMAMLAVVPNVFSTDAIMSSHNKIIFSQGMRVVKHQPVNPNSEFASSSSFSSSGEFSNASSFSSRKKEKFLERPSSIRKESSFSAKPSFRPKSDKDISPGSLFSTQDDAEFSSKPYPATKSNNGEFSGPSSLFSGSTFSMP